MYQKKIFKNNDEIERYNSTRRSEAEVDIPQKKLRKLADRKRNDENCIQLIKNHDVADKPTKLIRQKVSPDFF